MLLAAHTLLVVGRNLIFLNRSINDFGIMVVSQPLSIKHGTSFPSIVIFIYTLALSCIFLEPRLAELLKGCWFSVARFLIGQFRRICPGRLHSQHTTYSGRGAYCTSVDIGFSPAEAVTWVLGLPLNLAIAGLPGGVRVSVGFLAVF